MAQPPLVAFAAYDSTILAELNASIIPHFSGSKIFVHSQGRPISSGQEELRRKLATSALLVVGFTGIKPNDYWAIESACVMGLPCGLILKTEDRRMVAALSVTHGLRPFRFVISVGSMRSQQIKELFPGTPFMCDISSLAEPAEQISVFIKTQATSCRLEREAG